MEPPSDPVMSLLNIYLKPKKSTNSNSYYTHSRFTAALSAIDKIQEIA